MMPLRRVAPWLAVPLLWVVASLIESTRGGMLIDHGVAVRMPWSEVFRGALYDFFWWMLLGPVVLAVVRKIEQPPKPMLTRVIAHLLAGAAACVAYFLLRANLHLPADTMRLAMSWGGLRSSFPSSVGVYFILAAAASLLAARARARERERETTELALRASRLETQLSEAKLGILRAQLHPHFLFNALHAVSTLVDWRPKDARRMLTRLSDLLRMALELSEEQRITLARELEWLDHYIELQQLRFDDRLIVDIRCSDDAREALVPPLILQPLVENAIKHGIEPRAEGGHVEVIAEREGKWLRLRVRDDGAGLTSSSRKGGFGLQNTRGRLATIYGTEQQVVLRRHDDHTEAVVEMPWESSLAAPAIDRTA